MSVDRPALRQARALVSGHRTGHQCQLYTIGRRLHLGSCHLQPCHSFVAFLSTWRYVNVAAQRSGGCVAETHGIKLGGSRLKMAKVADIDLELFESGKGS